jgi:hypothetical protein
MYALLLIDYFADCHCPCVRRSVPVLLISAHKNGPRQRREPARAVPEVRAEIAQIAQR